MRSWSPSVKIAAALAGLIIGIIVGKEVIAWLTVHWLAFLIVIGCAAILTFAALAYHRYRTSTDRAEYAELEAHLVSADQMNLPEFESWLARMLVRGGFRNIRYMGRSGDFGGNFVATSPSNRKVVIRAKPDDGTLATRGARHIQALGADAHARWQADRAVLVTNADLHPLKTSARHDALANQLGVILIDRWELATWVADREPPAELTATPASLS